MAIDGPGPDDSDSVVRMLGVVLGYMSGLMQKELASLREKPWPREPVVICLVRCMRLLVEDHPQGANIAVPWPEVCNWEKAYFEWFDSVEKKIPAKFRGEMRSIAEKEFAQLIQALGGNRELLRSTD